MMKSKTKTTIVMSVVKFAVIIQNKEDLDVTVLPFLLQHHFMEWSLSKSNRWFISPFFSYYPRPELGWAQIIFSLLVSVESHFIAAGLWPKYLSNIWVDLQYLIMWCVIIIAGEKLWSAWKYDVNYYICYSWPLVLVNLRCIILPLLVLLSFMVWMGGLHFWLDVLAKWRNW